MTELVEVVTVSEIIDPPMPHALRGATVLWLLQTSGPLSTQEIAVAVGASYWSARRMMRLMCSSHIIPLTYAQGKWYLVKRCDFGT